MRRELLALQARDGSGAGKGKGDGGRRGSRARKVSARLATVDQQDRDAARLAHLEALENDAGAQEVNDD